MRKNVPHVARKKNHFFLRIFRRSRLTAFCIKAYVQSRFFFDRTENHDSRTRIVVYRNCQSELQLSQRVVVSRLAKNRRPIWKICLTAPAGLWYLLEIVVEVYRTSPRPPGLLTPQQHQSPGGGASYNPRQPDGIPTVAWHFPGDGTQFFLAGARWVKQEAKLVLR